MRSLVVLPGRKQQGYAGFLVAHAEAFARRDGVERLRNTSAADLFRARRYRPADRADAPAAIGATAQFASLCPDSATYLVGDDGQGGYTIADSKLRDYSNYPSDFEALDAPRPAAFRAVVRLSSGKLPSTRRFSSPP